MPHRRAAAASHGHCKKYTDDEKGEVLHLLRPKLLAEFGKLLVFFSDPVERG